MACRMHVHYTELVPNINYQHDRSTHMILVFAQKRSEESLWLLKITMMTIKSWLVFDTMENINGKLSTVMTNNFRYFICK